MLSHDSPGKAVAIFLGIVRQAQPHAAGTDAGFGRRGFQPRRRACPQCRGGSPRCGRDRALAAPGAAVDARLRHRLQRAAAGRQHRQAIRTADEIGYPVDLALVLANAAGTSPAATDLRSPADIQLAVRSAPTCARASRVPASAATACGQAPRAAASKHCAWAWPTIGVRPGDLPRRQRRRDAPANATASSPCRRSTRRWRATFWHAAASEVDPAEREPLERWPPRWCGCRKC